jgi:hypothetical protein
MKQIITRYLIALLLISGKVAAADDSKKDSVAIASVLNNQLRAWNEGSIAGFMKGYWNHPKLRFITKKGVTFGWQTVFDNYQRNYPNREQMGHLTFTNDGITDIGKRIYLVTGVWEVDAPQGKKSGYYSLLFKKISGTWVIIADHTF